MAPREETQQLGSPHCFLDGLYCEENSFEEDLGGFGFEDGSGNYSDDTAKVVESDFSSVLIEQDLLWESDELSSLISKEKQTHICFGDLVSDGSLTSGRKEAVEWVLRVKAHYGFTALTAVLAVNYFDRFISSLRFQKDKQWMSQLVAVACLSLAAKVEETQVPLLLDLQVEESKFLFEAKTIMRMELLVLSTLEWRMNPVTPISFFDHITRRLGLKIPLHWEFLRKCERLLLSVIADSRVMSYLPSVLATATMLLVVKEIEPYNQMEYRSQLMDVLKISEDKLNECYELILELTGSRGLGQKRKHLSVPCSPNGVIDASFNCDSSNDSWAAASSVASTPEPRFKRSRPHVQQMRLPSLNRMFVDVISSPH